MTYLNERQREVIELGRRIIHIFSECSITYTSRHEAVNAGMLLLSHPNPLWLHELLVL